MRFPLFILIVFLFVNPLISQENPWFYFRAKDTLFDPVFKKVGNTLVYAGNDKIMKSIFEKHTIYEFKKTYKWAKRKNLKKTFFVIAKDEFLLVDLLQKASHVFEHGEIIPEEAKKIYEPNDFGLTSTIGKNIGLQVNLDYLDVLGMPQAWYYTTGSRNVNIGISDAKIDTTNLEFKGKIKVFKTAGLADGHGSNSAGIAAAQGNNGYGATGVCFDCGIYSTNYGDFKNFAQLVELSSAGVRVINCSWVGSKYYPEAQAVVDGMFANGTILVAGAGNRSWPQTNGKLKLYPASYKNVISVSSVMYKHELVNDNILTLESGDHYAENIWGYVGRTIGFKDNDTLKKHHIWPISITTLNEEVDLLAPSVGQFRFSQFILKSLEIHNQFEVTSPTGPLVTGTIGLMLSLYPCLPIDEVETILKFTSSNIDHIEANKPYAGMYGAGMLHTGRAVEMVYKMFEEGETVFIENQNFTRWDFKHTSVSEKVVITNQTFAEKATLLLTAKNKIVIGKNTVLKPNSEGSLLFKIDPTLERKCELELREGFPE